MTGVDVGIFAAIAVLTAAGVYLLLDRSLTRMLMGIVLASNAANLLILTLSSPPGSPPIGGRFTQPGGVLADPLAQAMILTAIVITMGMSAFILALAYRSFTINTDDEVDDDPEDAKVLERQAPSQAPDFDASDDPVTGEPSALGDAFGPDGEPLTEAELARGRLDAVDTGSHPVAAAEGEADR